MVVKDKQTSCILYNMSIFMEGLRKTMNYLVKFDCLGTENRSWDVKIGFERIEERAIIYIILK
jgi:hypothetical protein